jgi:ATP-dependent Lon protease
MRDFRDAKAMAQTLRESLTSKAINISHTESLELVSRMLGVADWNTLSALLQLGRRDVPAPVRRTQKPETANYPAIPVRDLVPFPTTVYSLFLGREKSVHAVNQAWEHERELVLVIQRDSAVDEPRLGDVYKIGVLAQLLELDPPADGKTKIVTRVTRRVILRCLTVENGAFQAEVAGIGQEAIPDASDLIQRAVRRFETYVAAGGHGLPHTTWFSFDPTRDPGRVADFIATRVILPISDKYELLATLDPVMRLKKVDALMDPSVPLDKRKRRLAHFTRMFDRIHDQSWIAMLAQAVSRASR